MSETVKATDDEMFDGYRQMRAREILGDHLEASLQAMCEAQRWLAAHDADLTERVRAEQRETDAQIAEREVFGWEEYDEACINIAAAIREAGNTDA